MVVWDSVPVGKLSSVTTGPGCRQVQFRLMPPPVSLIDLDHLSERELRELNSRIVERLRLFQTVRIQHAMSQIVLGDRVKFMGHSDFEFGTVIRYNNKSVTVITDSGSKWRVAPGLLTVIHQAARTDPDAPEIRVPPGLSQKGDEQLRLG